MKQLTQSRFLRNVIIMATGTAGAQVITMVWAPIITRLYGPEAFGLLGTFMAVLAIVTPIAALTYPIAIVLPKADDDAKGIANLSVLLAFTITIFVAVVILFFGNAIAVLLNIQSISGFLLFIPVAMFFTAMQQIMQQWLIRKQQFKISARVAISQSLILNSSKVGLGLVYPTGVVLVVLATLGNALYATQLWLGSKKWLANKDRIDSRSDSQINLRHLAYKHKDFPLFRAPQVLINALTSSMPVLILAMFFDAVTVGYFTLSNSVLAAPALLIGKSVGSVFYPKIVGAIHNKEKGFPILIKAMFFLFAVSFFPFLTVFLFAEEIFSFVFGSEWMMSGSFASILTLSVFLGVVHRPCESIIYAYNLTRQYFCIELFFTMLMIACMYYFGKYGYSSLWIVFVYMILKSSYYLFIIMFCCFTISGVYKKRR